MIEFEWDKANREHLAAHSVSPAEFESVINSETTADLDWSVAESGEDRFRFVGITQEGRLIVGVYTIRNDKIRAVTAFDAGREEVREWRRRQE